MSLGGNASRSDLSKLNATFDRAINRRTNRHMSHLLGDIGGFLGPSGIQLATLLAEALLLNETDPLQMQFLRAHSCRSVGSMSLAAGQRSVVGKLL